MSQPIPDGIEKVERVEFERFEMHAMVPLSAVGPMVLMNPETMVEAEMLFAKWVAIHLIHGAPETDIQEFLNRYVGLEKMKGPDGGNGEIVTAIAQMGFNLLVAAEHLMAGQTEAEVRQQSLTKGQMTPDVVEIYMRRAKEVLEYCEATGIGPFEFERLSIKTVDSAERLSFEEAWGTAFERMGMGYSDEEIGVALIRGAIEADVERVGALWALVKHSKGQETEVLKMIRDASDDPTERKRGEKLFAAGKKALRRCQKHPAYKLLESFQGSQKLNGKLGCFQVPIGILVFIALLFTPPDWWMSLIFSFLLVTAMVIGRIIWDKIDISRTVSGILKACPQGSPEYVDAYRLFSHAAGEESGCQEELKQVVAKLSPVETAIETAADRTEQAMRFHGFFYSTDDQGRPVRIDMSPLQQRAFKNLVAPAAGWQNLDEVTYWHHCYRYVITAVGQGYVAWDERSYWLFYSNSLNEAPDGADKTYGVHVVEFTPNRMRYKWIETGSMGNLTGELRNLLETMWNWSMCGVGDARSQRLGPADMEILSRNIEWTDAMHQRMGEQYPIFDKEG